MKKIKTTLYILCFLFLSSCTTTSYRSFDELTTYRVIARSAVKSPDFNGQVSINWKQYAKETLDITIQGALGQGKTTFKIRPNESSAIFQGQTIHSTNPDELFYKLTNIQWPVSSSITWLSGKPNSNATSITYDSNGLPKSFIENGWLVEYQKWITKKELTLPIRLIISKEDIRLRITIENWIF